MARGHSQSAAARAKIAASMKGNRNAAKKGGKKPSVSSSHHDTLARAFVQMHGTAGAAAKARALVTKKNPSAKDKSLTDALIRAIKG